MPLVTPSTSKEVTGSSTSNTGRNAAPSRMGTWSMGAFNKSIKISDWAAGYANAASAKFGGERFWPSSGDFEEELAKCERILRAFTVEGIETEVDEKGEWVNETGENCLLGTMNRGL